MFSVGTSLLKVVPMFSSSLLILVDLLSELLNTLTPVWMRIRFEIAFEWSCVIFRQASGF